VHYIFFFFFNFPVTLVVWMKTAVKGRRWCSVMVTWCKCTTIVRYKKGVRTRTFLRVHIAFCFSLSCCALPQGNESVYALTLENNNGTFEVTPAVIDRRSRFTIMVRNNRLLDFESRPSVRFEVEYHFF